MARSVSVNAFNSPRLISNFNCSNTRGRTRLGKMKIKVVSALYAASGNPVYGFMIYDLRFVYQRHRIEC